MEICWDNLEGIYLTNKGNFRKGTDIYVEKDSCKKCREPYLTKKYRQSEYCCISCAVFGENNHNYGNVYSTERRKKMSDVRKGKKLTKNHRMKISNANSGKNHPLYGKKHTDKSKLKMSESSKGKNSGEKHYLYGQHRSEEVKNKISKNKIGKCMGKNNSNWKGGISCEPYCQNWSSDLKEYIKERDENRCLNPDCLGNIHRLSVHHIDYNKKNCEPQNLITLCTSCNSRANKDREWHEAWYQTIMYRRYDYIYEEER